MEALRWGRKTTRGGLSRDTLPRYCTLVFLFAQYWPLRIAGSQRCRETSSVRRARSLLIPIATPSPGTGWVSTRNEPFRARHPMAGDPSLPSAEAGRAAAARRHHPGPWRMPRSCGVRSHFSQRFQDSTFSHGFVRYPLPTTRFTIIQQYHGTRGTGADSNCVSRSSAGATTDK